MRLITYNIDGLPEKLDLKTLPLILRPIAWVYKLFKKTTIISVNDNVDAAKKITEISERLSSSKADIIAVQEDFNYHDELMSSLSSGYSCATYMGGFDLSKIFSKVECLTHFPLPRFKIDGLNILSNNKTVQIENEKIVRWKKSYGYFKHANDLLTHKGFRFYNVVADGNVVIDVYIVHMDADFYNETDCSDVSKDVEAREKQLQQLVEHIKQRNNDGSTNPIIIMGDTNSYYKYEWDKNNIEINLIHELNHLPNLSAKEAVPNNFSDCDRIFYVNNLLCNYKLSLAECYFDLSFDNLSDHKPLIADFKIDKV